MRCAYSNKKAEKKIERNRKQSQQKTEWIAANNKKNKAATGGAMKQQVSFINYLLSKCISLLLLLPRCWYTLINLPFLSPYII